MNDHETARPLRVLIVSFTYLVGVYQGKLHALSNYRDVEVALLAPESWKFSAWQRPFKLAPHYPGFRVFPAKVRIFNGRNGAFLYPFSAVWRAFTTFKPDLVYIEQEVFSLSTFQITAFARALHIPVSVFCWESMNHPLSLFRRLTRDFVLRSAQLITPGNRAAAMLLRRWGYEGPLEILPEVGVDTRMFFPRPNAGNSRPFRLGFVGRLVPEKGVDLILDAAKNLEDEGCACEVVLCGAGPEERALSEHAARLDLVPKVRWLGELRHEEVPDALAEMDALILPSRTLPGKWDEQFGHVLVEAMAMGIPVVGSSCGAIPDVIGRADLTFPEGDAQKMTRILRRLIEDGRWRAEVVSYCRQRVEANYTHERIASQLVTLWEEMLGSGVRTDSGGAR